MIVSPKSRLRRLLSTRVCKTDDGIESFEESVGFSERLS
jgi:hypothetical protein